jgi:NAD+ kinase
MIGVLDHPKISASAPLADHIEGWLNQRGHAVWRGSVGDDQSLARQANDLSLLVILGGDGSILRGARLVAGTPAVIFGVNLGRLGFLAEASPDDWPERLTRVLDGHCRVERRLLLQATVTRQGITLAHEFPALNEIVVSRGRQVRVLRFEMYVDGDHVASHVADGIITATPTGSTAYALGVGGPIMPPELPNFLVVPIAPHLTLDRAIVLYEEAVVRLVVHFDHEATVSADGHEMIELQDGDVVTITKSPRMSLFSRVDDPGYFYRRLLFRNPALSPR